MNSSLAKAVLRLASNHSRSRRKARELQDFDEELLHTPLRRLLASKKPAIIELRRAVDELLNSHSVFDKRAGLELLNAAGIYDNALSQTVIQAFKAEPSDSELLVLLTWQLVEIKATASAGEIIQKTGDLEQSNLNASKKRSIKASLISAAYILQQPLACSPIIEFMKAEQCKEKNGYYTSAAVMLSNILRRTGNHSDRIFEPLLLALKTQKNKSLHQYFLSELASGMDRVDNKQFSKAQKSTLLKQFAAVLA